jgi:hypothetical protein
MEINQNQSITAILNAILQKMDAFSEQSKQFNRLYKKFLTASEAAIYLGISIDSLYHLKHLIGYFKPSGKLTYYSIESLDLFLQRNKVKSEDEIHKEALSYTLNKSKEKPP